MDAEQSKRAVQKKRKTASSSKGKTSAVAASPAKQVKRVPVVKSESVDPAEDADERPAKRMNKSANATATSSSTHVKRKVGKQPKQTSAEENEEDATDECDPEMMAESSSSSTAAANSKLKKKKKEEEVGKTTKKQATTKKTKGASTSSSTVAASSLADGAVHSLPADFRAAIAGDSVAAAVWIDITPLARNEWICWATSCKKEETRQHRIEVGLDKMRKGMRRPCCWPGCPHR